MTTEPETKRAKTDPPVDITQLDSEEEHPLDRDGNAKHDGRATASADLIEDCDDEEVGGHGQPAWPARHFVAQEIPLPPGLRAFAQADQAEQSRGRSASRREYSLAP
eukprot:1408702-Amphidinium_carterae.1